MTEKLQSQTTPSYGWDRTESGLLVPSEGVKAYVDENDVIVTDSRSVTREDAEQGFVDAREKARQPLSPEELVDAMSTLINKLREAQDDLRAQRKGSDEVGMGQDESNLTQTVNALFRLRGMYEGKKDIDQELGETTEDYLDRMVATYRKDDDTFHSPESAVDATGYTGAKLYEYARMRKVHDALKSSPESARATILGETPVIKGSDDVVYEQAMLGTMHYGEDVEQSAA